MNQILPSHKSSIISNKSLIDTFLIYAYCTLRNYQASSLLLYSSGLFNYFKFKTFLYKNIVAPKTVSFVIIFFTKVI